MPGLPVQYFRALHIEPDFKSGTVWEFGDFGKMVEFFSIVNKCRVKSSRDVIVLQLRSVCGNDFLLIEKFFIDPIMLDLSALDHPRRKAKKYEIED